MTESQRFPGEERLLDILAEARRAPLPSSPSLPRPELGRQDDASTEPSEAEQRQVQALSRLIREVPERVASARRRRRVLAGALGFSAAAAVLVLALGGPFSGLFGEEQSTAGQVAVVERTLSLKQVVGNVIVTRANGQGVVLMPDMGVQDGDEVSTTAESFASLEFDGGTRVDLSNASTMQVVEREELSLRVGRVDINVPQLPADQVRTLAVRTPNAKVTVRGTIFSVEVTAANQRPLTRVGVTRGSVSVFHDGREFMVRAGELWSSENPSGISTEEQAANETNSVEDTSTEAATLEGDTVLDGTVAKDTVPKDTARRNRGRSASSPSVDDEVELPQSSLQRQNRIFERGLRARDQGDDERATYWFDQLLKRYPNSPLAEAAERERSAARGRLRND